MKRVLAFRYGLLSPSAGSLVDVRHFLFLFRLSDAPERVCAGDLSVVVAIVGVNAI